MREAHESHVENSFPVAVYFDKSKKDLEYYYFATILDPRFKDTIFKSYEDLASTLFSKTWIKDCAVAFVNMYNRFYNAQDTTGSHPAILSKAEELESSNEFPCAWKAQIPSLPSGASSSSSLSLEITEYFKEPLTTMAPLTWWHINTYRFPQLAAMARDFYAFQDPLLPLSVSSVAAGMLYLCTGIMLEKGIAGGFTTTN
ncbi:hypothetical protein BDV93DRAFT_554102 [Ceratobasidium sp. AG-I]|nr:hypothetical protein BDV93DRAFT_554102 [Ceratobasidium sp. AG-I]